MTAIVADVTEQTFDRAVVEASASQPVVVDFWAPWCGPCRQLSPMLEQMAQRFGEDVRVVKLNVDEAPNLARRYGVQGIPAVKAFRDGQVVNEFTGLQPAQAVEQFFSALVPTKADRLVMQAAARPEASRSLLEQALDLDPAHAGALVALARLARAEGRTADARALLDRASQDPEARRLLAELRLESGREGDEALDALAAHAQRSPDAALAYGRALVGAQRHAEAVDPLLRAVADPATREDARTLLLDLFAVLGDDHEITRRARPRLASALFA
jgi:putative thioredoxin